MCSESTIPVILDLINEDNGINVGAGQNQDLTMRQIRENLISKKQDQNQAEANKSAAVPYIPLNYSQKIVICKRCRFKFHSKCLEDKGIEIPKQSDSWLCQFCDDKIKELQSLNLWDYENNKKKKKDEPQSSNQIQSNLQSEKKNTEKEKEKVQSRNYDQQKQTIVKKRILENKKIFKIETQIRKQLFKNVELTEEQKRQNFIKDFPMYKGETGDVVYPVFDRKDHYKQYGSVIEFKQKPKYTQLDNVSKYLGVTSVMNLISRRLGEEDLCQPVFFPYLFVMLSLFYDEVIQERRFEFYQRVLDASSAAFFQLLRFVHQSQPESEIYNKLFVFIWGEFSRSIERIIDVEEDDISSIIKKINSLQKLNVEEMFDYLHHIQLGLYNLESFCSIISNRENLNIDNLKDPQVQTSLSFYLECPKAYINQSICLGQDQEERIYTWFPLQPQYIFVENQNDWGYYRGEKILHLLESLEYRGVREGQLAQNIDTLLDNNLVQPRNQNTIIKPKQCSYSAYQTSMDQLKLKLSETEQTISEFLQQKYSRWANKSIREQFRVDVKNSTSPKQLLILLRLFVERLQLIEKVVLHPKVKHSQDNSELGLSNEAMEEEYGSSDDGSEQQSQESQAQFTSTSPQAKDGRKTRQHSNLRKPAQPSVPTVIQPKRKESVPLPPYEELENQLHGVRRTQTKIFSFTAHLKIPFLFYLSKLEEDNAEGLYFALYILQMVINKYVDGKMQMRNEQKEKGKRGRRSKEEEERLLQLKQETQMEVEQPKRKSLFELALEMFEQREDAKAETQTNEEKPQKQTEDTKKEKHQVIYVPVNPESLANRREKRGNAGRNPKIHDTMGHKKYCTKCVKPMENETKCPKCQRLYHQECLKGDLCQVCKTEQQNAAAANKPKRQSRATVLFYDE